MYILWGLGHHTWHVVGLTGKLYGGKQSAEREPQAVLCRPTIERAQLGNSTLYVEVTDTYTRQLSQFEKICHLSREIEAGKTSFSCINHQLPTSNPELLSTDSKPSPLCLHQFSLPSCSQLLVIPHLLHLLVRSLPGSLGLCKFLFKTVFLCHRTPTSLLHRRQLYTNTTPFTTHWTQWTSEPHTSSFASFSTTASFSSKKSLWLSS